MFSNWRRFTVLRELWLVIFITGLCEKITSFIFSKHEFFSKIKIYIIPPCILDKGHGYCGENRVNDIGTCHQLIPHYPSIPMGISGTWATLIFQLHASYVLTTKMFSCLFKYSWGSNKLPLYIVNLFYHNISVLPTPSSPWRSEKFVEIYIKSE